MVSNEKQVSSSDNGHTGLFGNIINSINASLKDLTAEKTDYVVIPLDWYVNADLMSKICKSYVKAGWPCVAYRSYGVSTKNTIANEIFGRSYLTTEIILASSFSDEISKKIDDYICYDAIEYGKHIYEERNK